MLSAVDYTTVAVEASVTESSSLHHVRIGPKGRSRNRSLDRLTIKQSNSPTKSLCFPLERLVESVNSPRTRAVLRQVRRLYRRRSLAHQRKVPSRRLHRR